MILVDPLHYKGAVPKYLMSHSHPLYHYLSTQLQTPEESWIQETVLILERLKICMNICIT